MMTHKARLRISQEMVAIITFGVVLGGLQLAIIADIRAERAAWQAAWQEESRQWVAENQRQRAAWQAENQRQRAAWQARQHQRNEWQEDVRQLRDEARSDPTADQR